MKHHATLALASVLVLSLSNCFDDTPAEPDQAPSSPGERPGRSSSALVTSLAFRQISAGTHHSCAVTRDNVAFCGGENSEGQLGDGTTTRRRGQDRVAGGLRFRQV